jgi:hypothetical protein
MHISLLGNVSEQDEGIQEIVVWYENTVAMEQSDEQSNVMNDFQDEQTVQVLANSIMVDLDQLHYVTN